VNNAASPHSDSVPRPDLDQIRRHLLTALYQALDDWNLIVSLKHTEATKDRVRVILCFMEQIVHAVAQAIDLKKEEIEHKYWKWKVEDELTETLRLIKLEIQGNDLRERDECEFSGDSLEYAALKSGSYISHDRHLVLRAWLPALDRAAELVLLFQLAVPSNRILTSEVAAIIETYYEILLTGIRSADYLSTKEVFFANARRRVPDKELAHTSEWLLYHEVWRSCWERLKEKGPRNAIGLDRWLDPNAEPILLDSPDQDYVLASYLASLMYLTNQGDHAAKQRLEETLQEITEDKVLIRISRGPTIIAGSKMERTRCATVQAKIQLRGIPKETKERLFEQLEPHSGLSNRQSARRLKAQCSIVECEAKRLLSGETPVNETEEQICLLMSLAHRLAQNMRPLLDKALRNSNECIELSSRWLDAWFGLRLIESKVLPHENLEIYEPSRIAELVKSWACYFRYLLDYFVLRQTQTRDDDALPDLPTEPVSDAVEQAQLTLICEWAHACGVPRTIPLHAWLSKTYETELALYSLSGKGSHRQHLFHVQDECLLGCAVLYSRWHEEGESETYLQLLSRVSGHKPEQLLCNWLVAALLHDIGYALQVIPRGLDALPPGIVEGLDELVEDIRRRLRQAPSEVADYDPTPTRASGKLEAADHAHVSMAAVLSCLGSLCDQWQTASVYNPAAAAIVDHGSKDTLIDYSTNPLSALIVVCDQLQDWGRIRLDTSLLARSFLASIRMAPGEEPDPVLLKKLFASSRLYVRVEDLDSQCNLVHPLEDGTRIMHFLVHGPRAGNGGYEPAVAWLDVCRAFQRIRSSKGEPLPQICVVLQHGVAEDGISELHRLSRFAHDDAEQRGTILDWLAQVRGQEIIRYGCGKESCKAFSRAIPCDAKHDRYEWIEYTIPKLNNNEDRPLKGLPGKLYQSYRDYRKTATAKKT
jgi:hypothetical protein